LQADSEWYLILKLFYQIEEWLLLTWHEGEIHITFFQQNVIRILLKPVCRCWRSSWFQSCYRKILMIFTLLAPIPIYVRILIPLKSFTGVVLNYVMYFVTTLQLRVKTFAYYWMKKPVKHFITFYALLHYQIIFSGQNVPQFPFQL